MVVGMAKDICDLFRYLYSFIPPCICIGIVPWQVMLMPNQQIKMIDPIIIKMPDVAKDNRIFSMPIGYKAPEQYGGSEQIDIRTAIYALGMTMYHLVTGRHPENRRMKFCLFGR